MDDGDDNLSLNDEHQQQEGLDEEANEEQIVKTILKLGNDILQNLGMEEFIEDIDVFFSDSFFI